MEKICKEKVLEAFNVISSGESYKSTLGNAIALLIHVFDVSERKSVDKKKRIEVVIGLDWITPKYKLILEEFENVSW